MWTKERLHETIAKRMSDYLLVRASAIVFILFFLVSGCHSGTIRGVGSDVEKLGQKMER